MTDILSLDEGYSTTRLLTQEKPEIINTPEDKFETVLFLPEGENRKGEGGLRIKGYFKKSFDDKPLISIITVVFNGEKYLEETIQSVINQTYSNVEYIIIDGGSSDGTLDIIKKYEERIDYWVSEKDTGIYHAMNKGITLVSGKWLIFINSGDYIQNNSIQIMFEHLNNSSIVFGDVKYESGRIFKSSIDYKMNLKNTLHHQSVLYGINCFKSIGLFDLKYKILADYNCNFSLYKKNFSSKKINHIITICSDFGVSDTPKINNYLEEIYIRNFYINSKILKLILASYSVTKFVLKKLVRFVK